MAIQPVNTIKSWFETGDKPTQNQFWDWLESFVHKNDSVPMSQVSGLNAALTALATQTSVDALKAIVVTTSASSISVSLPAGTILNKIRVKSNSAQTLNCGTSVGGSQILAAESLNANQVGLYVVDIDVESAMTIYFSALAGSNQIKIYLQQ